MNRDVPNPALLAKTAGEKVGKWESEKSRATHPDTRYLSHLLPCPFSPLRLLLLLALVIGHWSLVITAPAATPPQITLQPEPSTNLTATEVIFTVAATGDAPLRYQWYFATPELPATQLLIPGETNTTLIYTNVGAFQEGWFSVTITNTAGAITSNPVYLTVLVPPLVTREPAHLTAPTGGTATFTITATGDAPLRYQWYFNIIDEIVGATNATLVLTNLQKSQAGGYQIEVSNDYDTVNSIEARLTVKDPPAITTAPASQTVPAGATVPFTVAVTGDGPFAYQWYFNATNTLFGATSNTLTLANAQLANTGDYTVRITTDVGALTSPPARLTILQAPAITQQPASVTAILGNNATFTVTAQGTAPLSYQWRRNGTPIPGATNSDPPAFNLQRSTLNLPNVQPSDAGLYTVTITNTLGTITSLNASLTVYTPPTLTTQPTNQTVRAGQTAQLIATATGTAPLTYQWRFNGTNLPPLSAQNPSSQLPTLTLTNLQLAQAGQYTLTVSNLAGTITSAPPAQLTVSSPPLILAQPISRAVLPGGTATFTIQAAGDQPLTYQWNFNGTPIPGATNSEPPVLNVQRSTFNVPNAHPSNAGPYTVRITNPLGTVLSAPATLAVKLPPTLTAHPASLTRTQGHTASFEATVTGDGPFAFQWNLNGTPIPGATNSDPPALNLQRSTLDLQNIQPSDAGQYTLTVTNDVGTATSTSALLTIRTPPTILTQPASQYAAPGGTATFEVQATGDQPITYQWNFNGTPIPGATNAEPPALNLQRSTFNLQNVQPTDDGLYTLTLSNQIGTLTSTAAALQVRNPPVLTAPPQSLTSTQGFTATFTAAVTGDGPFAFQWNFNGTPIPGATNSEAPALNVQRSTFNLQNVQPSDAGQYTLRITNQVGTVLSPPATLTIRALPVITQQPISLVVTQGQNATFTLAATSDTPLTYQWRHRSIPLAGNAPSLAINGVLPANAGAYDAIVANTYGSVTSAVASLTVYGLDYGDAPEPAYATLLANNGARHVIVPGIHLGLEIDTEPDGQPSPDATGDDASVNNDEDGVRFIGPLHLGQPANIEVIASTNGHLSAWIDFNRAGGWAQTSEQVFNSVALQLGTNLLTFQTPAAAALGATVARFRFSTAPSLAVTGLAPDGEVEDYTVTIEPAVNLMLTQVFSSTEIAAGTAATLTIHATNGGPSDATGVILTNYLSRRSTFVSATSSQGNCTHLNGVVLCPIGSLATGAGVSVSITTTIGQGTNSATSTIRAIELDPTPADASASSAIIGTSLMPQFANSDILLLPLPDAGAADPYPSSILVAGVTGVVHQLTVTLRGLSHDYPADIDLLLVGPDGHAVVLMSDAGFDLPVVDATITFDDLLGQPLPDSIRAITTGSYRPFNFAPVNDFFPAPAPAGPYSADLAAFRGTDPNGVWALYLMDDSLDNGGSDVPGFIADGWTLNMVTADPLADLGVSVTAPSGIVSIGEGAIFSITITNHGPTASAALCQNTLPPALSFVSASTAQGACSHSAGVVTCDLGEIAPGEFVTFSITAAASIGGLVTNVFTVAGSQVDLNAANNAAAATLSVRPVVDLAVNLHLPTSNLLLLQPGACTVSLTNHGPNSASGVWLTNLLPVGVSYLSSSASQGACSASGQTVVCSLGVVPVGAAPSVVVRFVPASSGVFSFTSLVAASELDAAPGNDGAAASFTVLPATDLAVSASFAAAAVPLGREFVVSLTVTNAGPLVVDAAVSNALPATTTFVSAFTARGACTNVGSVVQCAFSQLAPGEAATVLLRARATVLGSLTNSAGVTGSLPDFDLSNNAATALASVAPDSNLVLGISDRPNPVWLGENLTYTVGVTNLGPSAAAGVVISNVLPAGVAFVSAGASQGACARNGDVVRCELGGMAANGSATVSIVARPPQAGWITNSVSVFAATDSERSDNTATRVSRVITGNVNLVNAAPIAIPLLGLANPYPSTITVSGISAAVFRVRVSLLNLSHSFADDLDVLLVGPDGRATLLMSDGGGEFSINAASVTFDDAATTALGDSSPIVSGTVRPSNFGQDQDFFAAPAPTAPYATNLSIFNGSDPNGSWSLYIMDDAEKDSGSVAGGWRLMISAFEPMADLSVAQVAAPFPAGTGSNVFFTTTVSNLGPSIATGVRLTNSLPVGFALTGFSNAHGACSVTRPGAGGDGPEVVCVVASILPGGAASLSVVAASVGAGSFTNVVSVGFDGVDLRPANNAASVAVSIVPPPFITLQPVSQTVPLGGAAQFVAAASGAAPLAYQWFYSPPNINPNLNLAPSPLPSATNPALAFASVQLAHAGSYRLRVTNLVGTAWSDPASLLIPGPPSLSAFPNLVSFEDTVAGPIAFTVQDFDTAAESLVVGATSSNAGLVPPSAFAFAGAGQVRSLRITPATNQSGSASIAVWVRDSTGAATTNAFTLVVRPVLDPILIVVQPRDRLSVTGAAVSLSVSAVSGLPLSFQWERNGVLIAGATNAELASFNVQRSTFNLPNVQSTNAGVYRVRLTSADTNVWSASAGVVLTNALPVPSILSISQHGSTATVTFSTVVGLVYSLEYKRLLEDAAWSVLGSIPGTGDSEILTDSAASVPTRFYRVRAQ